jgi:hypothetical protein
MLFDSEIQEIRNFLKACLNDGHYFFTVSSKNYLLEQERDVEEVLRAIKKAPENVQNYRLRQARKYLPRIA